MAAALLLSAVAGGSRSSGGTAGLLLGRLASALTGSSWSSSGGEGSAAVRRLRSFAADAARAPASRDATTPSPSPPPASAAAPPPSPRARLLRQRKAPVSLTPAAIERVKALLEKRHKEYLRLGIKRRGCNGLAYTLNYADAPSRLDEVVEVGIEAESEAKAGSSNGDGDGGGGSGGAPSSSSPSPSSPPSSPLPSRTAKRTVKVLVDPGALMHVVGTTMDWVEDEVRASFVFTNPNQEGSCGCGESFTSAADVAARKK